MPASTVCATNQTQMVRTPARDSEACRGALGATKLTGPNDSVLCSSQPNMTRLRTPDQGTNLYKTLGHYGVQVLGWAYGLLAAWPAGSIEIDSYHVQLELRKALGPSRLPSPPASDKNVKRLALRGPRPPPQEGLVVLSSQSSTPNYWTNVC